MRNEKIEVTELEINTTDFFEPYFSTTAKINFFKWDERTFEFCIKENNKGDFEIDTRKGIYHYDTSKDYSYVEIAEYAELMLKRYLKSSEWKQIYQELHKKKLKQIEAQLEHYQEKVEELLELRDKERLIVGE